MFARKALLTAGMAAALSAPTLGVVAFADSDKLKTHGRHAANGPTPAAVVLGPVIAASPTASASAAASPEGLSVVTVTAPVPATLGPTNPYAPSGVGEGTNQGAGKAPANGTVGNADNQNPPGQAPNGTDPNNGYECDGNKGVGNKGGNPAHSGCRSATPTPSRSTTSPTPSASTGTPTPSSSPSASRSPSQSPPAIITGDPSFPATGPTPTPTPRSPQPTYQPPTPPCPEAQPGDDAASRCLPFTGAPVDDLAAGAGLMILLPTLSYLIARLTRQVRELILLG